MYLEITSPPSSLLLKDWLAGRPQESENEYICIFSINFITINLPTEAYTSTLGLLTYWLTDWLNCPHKALKKLANVETHIKVKLLQGFRQKVTWPTLPGGSNLDYVYSKGNMYKHWNKNPSTFLQSPPPCYALSPNSTKWPGLIFLWTLLHIMAICLLYLYFHNTILNQGWSCP